MPGIFILIVLGSLFGVFRGKQKKYQNQWIKAKDERMNVTSKTFDIIKILKLYSWERLFKNLINDKRKIENKANYKKFNLQVMVEAISGTVETLLIMICIIFFNVIYKEMEVDNILTSLYIIHGLVEPLFDLPTFFVSLFEISISLVRIQNFLSLEKHDYSQIEYLSKEENNPDSRYSIIISNVDFGIEKTVNDTVIINDKNNINNINENNDSNDSNDDLNTTNENIDANTTDINNEEQQENNNISVFRTKTKFNDSFDSTDGNANITNDYESKIEYNKSFIF